MWTLHSACTTENRCVPDKGTWGGNRSELVGAIILIVFLASEGQSDQNEYGANPKFAPAAG